MERVLTGLLVLGMGGTVLYGILKLRQMQTDYDVRCLPGGEAGRRKERHTVTAPGHGGDWKVGRIECRPAQRKE